MNLNLSLLLPEWILTGFLLLLMVKEIFSKLNQPKVTISIAALGAAAALIGAGSLYGTVDAAFNGMFILDPFAVFFKVFFAIAAFVVIQMSRTFFADTFKYLSEFFLIILCTLIGLFVLVSANDFLLMFVSLEIVTLSFYMLTAFSKEKMISVEAGLKYLILGSLASAFVIFGISLIYASTGATSFAVIRDFLLVNKPDAMLIIGILMMIAGLGFKVAAFPFQFWVPDVYEGAPTPVVAFLSVASKAAGFAILMRIIFTVFGIFDAGRAQLFSILALLTLLYGNLGALVQTNIKRLLGYSSVGHAGYLLIAIAAGGSFGKIAVLYYLIAYGLSTLAVFLVVNTASIQLESDHIHAYQGLGRRSPFLAAMLFLSLLSLAGAPPLAGFSGKYFVLLSAVKANQLWLALIGAMTVAVSLYYYLNIVRVMYFEEPASEKALNVGKVSKIVLLVLTAGILLAGIWHTPFYELTAKASAYLT